MNLIEIKKFYEQLLQEKKKHIKSTNSDDKPSVMTLSNLKMTV